MVSPLKRLRRDPDGMGRGPGIYYKRYKGKGRYSKAHRKWYRWAKYNEERDAKRKAGTNYSRNMPISYAHATDGKGYKPAKSQRKLRTLRKHAKKRRWV